MNLLKQKKVAIFDIEANGFLDVVTKVHCIVIKDFNTKQLFKFKPHEIEQGIEKLKEYDWLVAHNGISYDMPVLNKLYGVDLLDKAMDSYVLSQLAKADRPLGHSIESWGKFLGSPKIDFHEYDMFSQDMLDYCVQDVEINYRLFKIIIKELESFSDLSIKLELKVAKIIAEQERNGVLFDVDKANYLIESIDSELSTLYNIVRPYLSLEYSIIGSGEARTEGVKNVFKKNGDLTKNVTDWAVQNKVPLHSISGRFCRISWSEPDIGSRIKLIKQLLRLGWQPQNFTEKGSPQLTTKDEYNATIPCPSLLEFGELGNAVARYYTLRHRQSQISGWLSKVRPDNKLSAGAITNATNTGRMTHRVVANVPRVTSIFGEEMRSLFTVPDGYVMVGADLSGIELRILAHYMGDKEYIDLILNGDIHTYNQELAGLPTRDNAKTFIYGFLYGAGNEKIGQIVNKGSDVGKELKEQFLEGLPSLKHLISRINMLAQRGHLSALDGRLCYLRTDEVGNVKTHTALNTLLQAGGSIAFKVSLAFIYDKVLTKYEGVKLLISYHDEVQLQVPKYLGEEVGKKVVECMELAGSFLKLQCPITGEFKVGNNWADTH